MAYKTIQRVFLPNLKLFGPTKARVLGQKSSIIFYVMWENRLVGILLPTNMAATKIYIYIYMETFQTVNSCNTYIYLYIDLKLAQTFQNGVIVV